MQGILLCGGTTKAPRRQYVHNETVDWDVTSDISFDNVPHVDIIHTTFPGRLGTYIYPKDAVFSLRHSTTTTPDDLCTTMHEERSTRASVWHMHHMTVDCPGAANAVVVDEDEDDEDDEDDEENDDDDACGDVAPPEWDDDDESDSSRFTRLMFK